MASKYDICSMALTNLRANTISSFDDGSNEGEVCGVYYDMLVKDILSRNPWSFALKKRQMTQDATAPVNEYTYRHIIPSDCERLYALYDTNSVGASPVRDYDILERYVQSNYSALYAEYTYYVAEATWPGYFLQYAVAALSAMLAMPITDDQDLADRWQIVAYGTGSEGESGGKFAVARSIDAQQKPFDRMPTPEIISARFS